MGAGAFFVESGLVLSAFATALTGVLSPFARFAAAMLSSTCFARSRSNETNALPIAQCTVFPSALHVGNSPPMSVRRRAGNAAFAGLATDTVGVGPPRYGTVTT